MDNPFLAFVDKLIADEPALLTAQKAEDARLAEAARKDKERVDELRPRIEAKLGEVSAIWGEVVRAIEARSPALGFTARVGGSREGEGYKLEVGFPLNAGSIGIPLTLTVTQRGDAQFEALYPTSFDFLEAEPDVFRKALTDHVAAVFRKVKGIR